MSRPYRIEFPGAVYHVSSRGNNHQPIFIDDRDRRLFLSLLGKTAEKFKLEIHAFCLMGNHYHLFLRTPEPNLHLALQWLGANYTRAFNRCHDRDGHLFKGRYHAVLIDESTHWQYLSAYIHLNPVRAGLVKDPFDWPWSSAQDYFSSTPRHPWLRPGPVLESYGAGEAERRRFYRRQLLDLAGRPDSSWDDLRDTLFLGEKKRWEELKKEHPPSGRTEDVADYRRRPHGPVDFEAELERLAVVFETTIEIIRRGGTTIRPVVYYHLVQHCGLNGARVAEHFGVTRAAVTLGIRRLEEAMGNDPDLRRRVSELTRCQS